MTKDLKDFMEEDSALRANIINANFGMLNNLVGEKGVCNKENVDSIDEELFHKECLNCFPKNTRWKRLVRDLSILPKGK